MPTDFLDGAKPVKTPPAGGDFLEGASPVAPPPPPKPGMIQTLKNNFNANTQPVEYAPSDTIGQTLKKQVQNVGAGGGDVIRSLGHTIMHPMDTMAASQERFAADAKKPFSENVSDIGHSIKSMASNPERTIGQIGAGTILGEAGGRALSGAGSAIKAIPSTTRAAATLTDIGNAAKDVPVSMSKTSPALGEFRQSVATGGKNAPVMTKLSNRITPPNAAQQPQPINFPEARDFYSNISRATAKPGFLRRAIESPGTPAFRYNAGNVREALNSDLTNAADAIGRGKDYTGAMNEYRRAAQLNKALKVGGGLITAEALRRSGVLGKVVGGVADAAQ